MNNDHTRMRTPITASTNGIRQLIIVLAATLAVGGCAKKKTGGIKTSTGVYEQLAKKLAQQSRTQDAQEVRQACAGAAKRSCSCVQTAAKLGLDRDLYKNALLVLGAKPAGCRVGGLKAEALARAKRLDEAQREARAALKANPHNRYATYAVAHIHYVKGDAAKARVAAQRAIQKGRGRVAHLLVGLLAFHQKQLPAALKSFQMMLTLDAKDVAAIFNMGVVYHRQNHYRLSREAYLRALRIHPRHADARYNMVVLTHGVGAVAEARHHLKKFRFLLPREPRIARLEALLKTKPRRRPMLRRPPAPHPSMTAPPRPGPSMTAPQPRATPRPRPRPKGQNRPVGPR